MTRQRLTSIAVVTLGLAALGAGLTWALKPKGAAAPQVAATSAAPSTWKRLATGIRGGDVKALTEASRIVLEQKEKATVAVDDAEAADLVELLDSLRGGFLRFAPLGRSSCIAVSTHILDRFRVEPAPRAWTETLRPIHDLITAGLADAHAEVRVSALNELGQHWNWLPGLTMTPAEEHSLADWKDTMVQPAGRCLSDREPQARAAAVGCVGALPIDAMAAPAVANVEYPDNPAVRYKALMTFANRPNLLSVDTILKRLHDTEPAVAELSEIILKGRGLTKEQIYLGRQVYNPHPEVRVAVIPLIRDRTDIDPVVWFLQLSHDPDDAVRAKAVEALVDRTSPEVDKRLREIASTDSSPAVRAAAGKHVARQGESTAALPPLPGSTSLNPKAN